MPPLMCVPSEPRPSPGRGSFIHAPVSARRADVLPHSPVPSMPPNGLEAIFLANRDKLLRFLAARGAGDAADDVLHDLWLKLSGRPDGPIANPLSYLYRAAERLMIDRYRARRQSDQRERDWHDLAGGSPAAGTSEEVLAARQEVERVAAALATLGSRCETVFRRVRLDGVPQRQVAADLGISLSTVESDLRLAARAILAVKEQVR